LGSFENFSWFIVHCSLLKWVIGRKLGSFCIIALMSKWVNGYMSELLIGFKLGSFDIFCSILDSGYLMLDVRWTKLGSFCIFCFSPLRHQYTKFFDRISKKKSEIRSQNSERRCSFVHKFILKYFLFTKLNNEGKRDLHGSPGFIGYSSLFVFATARHCCRLFGAYYTRLLTKIQEVNRIKRICWPRRWL